MTKFTLDIAEIEKDQPHWLSDLAKQRKTAAEANRKERLKARRKRKAEERRLFDPDQPRDESGKWTDGGGSSGSSDDQTPTPKLRLASSKQLVSKLKDTLGEIPPGMVSSGGDPIIVEDDLISRKAAEEAISVAEKMKAQGFPVPKAVYIGRDLFTDAVYGYTLFPKDSEGNVVPGVRIAIPATMPETANVDDAIAAAFGQKDGDVDEFAPRNMHDVVVHEMAHAAFGHHGKNQSFTPEEYKIARTVSTYAGSMPDEFIAETFVRLARGETLSDEVMKLYEKKGGKPLPKGVKMSLPWPNWSRAEWEREIAKVQGRKFFDPDQPRADDGKWSGNGGGGGSKPANAKEADNNIRKLLGPRKERRKLTVDSLTGMSREKLNAIESAYKDAADVADNNNSRMGYNATLQAIRSEIASRNKRGLGEIALYDPDQPRDETGKWSSDGSGGGGGESGDKGETPKVEPGKVNPSEIPPGYVASPEKPEDLTTREYERPVPIKVETIDEAVDLILQGKVVELPDVRAVNTLLDKMAGLAKEAKSLGREAPNYDLCQVSVAGSNLFCGSKLRSEEYPNGVPRLKMPQLGGTPVSGTRADALPRTPWNPNEVDGANAFIDHLKGLGINVTRGVVPAAKLKASQAELVGSKVASMMVDKSFNPAANPVFVSRDNYVVDGHHRWAAVVGRDAEDGSLGESEMNEIRVDAPISEVLHLANEWADAFGIAPAAGVKKMREQLARLGWSLREAIRMLDGR